VLVVQDDGLGGNSLDVGGGQLLDAHQERAVAVDVYDLLVRLPRVCAQGRGDWACEQHIPMQVLSDAKPKCGTRWRISFFRCDRADRALLARRPTPKSNFPTPEKLGVLEIVE